jgi:osmoprotectant transport system ATP-binding protein
MRRLHSEVAKTVIFVTHDIDEAITMGQRIAILRPGGVLAQYDTPDAILAHPADDFVERFIGEDRALRRLALHRIGEIELEPVGNPERPSLRAPAASTVRNAVSLLVGSGESRLLVVGDDGAELGVLTLARAAELLR